jgi:hypothetical protein
VRLGSQSRNHIENWAWGWRMHALRSRVVGIKDVEQLKEGDVCGKSFPIVHLCLLVLANDNRDSH